MGNQQSGPGGNGSGGDKKNEKEKKRYEPPVPTRVGKKRKQVKVRIVKDCIIKSIWRN
jgi:26S proteasome regulatory subunit T2